MRTLVAVVLAATLGGSAPAVPRLDHVVVVVFENKERAAVLESGAAPSFARLAHDYADLTEYHALTHPSLPNYLALVSGSTQGITDDCTDCRARGASIGTLLTVAKRPWLAYAEGFPGSPSFAKKHVPFLYFAGQASHVRPLRAFDARHLPAYSFVAPDLCSDAHDCSISVADRWLARFVPPLLLVPRTAVFVLFDEGTTNAGGGGHVAAIVAGTAVRPHSTYARATGHYSVLRTIEDALGVSRLGASAHARPLTGIWR